MLQDNDPFSRPAVLLNCPILGSTHAVRAKSCCRFGCCTVLSTPISGGIRHLLPGPWCCYCRRVVVPSGVAMAGGGQGACTIHPKCLYPQQSLITPGQLWGGHAPYAGASGANQASQMRPRIPLRARSFHLRASDLPGWDPVLGWWKSQTPH